MTLGESGARLSSVTVAVPEAESPVGSVAVATHDITSFREAVLESNIKEEDVPSVLPCVSLLHTYVVVNVWLSASEEETTQLSVSSLYASAGVIEMESITGALFPTVTVAESVVVAPYPSVTEAVHNTSSSGWAREGVRLMLLPVPNKTLPLVHVYVGVSDSKSASETFAVHVNVVLVSTPLDGVIVAALKTGAVLSSITDAEDVASSPAPSVAVMVHVTTSVG